MQPSFQIILFHQTLVILDGRGRLISCEKNTTFVAKNINTLYTINIQSIWTCLFSVVVVFLDGPMHFYLSQNSRNLLRVSNFVVRQVSKTNNREDLHNSTLYNERVTSVRWQKHHFHTLYCYWKNWVRPFLKYLVSIMNSND